MEYQPLSNVTLLPPSENWLFIGAHGYLTAFDVSESVWTEIWKTNLEGSGYGPVTFHCNKTSIHAGCGSKVYALSTWEGNVEWALSLGPLLTRGDVDVRFVDGKVICGCLGFVTAISSSGEKLWEVNLEGTGFPPITTICVGDIIYAATTGYVFSISLDGQLLWKYNNPGQGLSSISLASIGNKGENHLSLGMRGYLRKIGINGEQIDHSFNLKGTSYSLVVQLLWQGRLYVGSHGIISAHDPFTNEYIWKNKLPGLGHECCCSLLPYVTTASTPTVIVGFRGFVISLHALTGEQQWYYSLPNSGYSFVSLCPKGNQLFVGSMGRLYLLNPDTGLLLGKDDLKGMGYGHVTLGTIEYQMDQQASNLLFYHLEEKKRRKEYQ